jgi:hypothetical protein
MAINSAQGIASLYRGNPPALQQSIQKEQQAKPGFAPDLQKMLALQIITNEEDSATAQKAMDQLKQMSGGQGGKPPTVMESLQQQAAQKLQAQAVQAQQKQQGLQALMQQAPAGPVPENTPQPEPQPTAQGIDQSDRVEFAGAEGGIVAFESGGDVDAAKEEAKAAIAQLQSYGLAQRKNDPEGYEAAQARAAAAKEKLMAVQSTYAQEMSAAGVDRPVQVTGMPAARPKPAAPTTDTRAALNKADAAVFATPGTPAKPAPAPAPAAPPARDLKALAAQRAQAAAAQQAQAAGPVAEEAPAPVAESDAMKMQKARMNASPEAKRAADVAEYRRMVGDPDTAQHDRLIAELEKRKESLAPKQGYEGLMEYLSQISANSQPGRGSFASGAAGARGMDKLNKERQLEQFELSKQAIEVSQKKLDTVRAYAKDVYGIGKSAFDQVYKEQFEAAKEIVKSEDEARKLAQENTLKRLQMKNNLDVQALQNQGQLARSEGNENKLQVEVLKAELASIDKDLAKLLPVPYGTNKDKIAVLEAQKARVQKDLRAAGGVSTIAAAPGAASPGGTTRMRFDAQGNPIK